MPRLTLPQVRRVLSELLPRRRWTTGDLRRWLAETQRRNERAKQAHLKRRLARSRDPTQPVYP